MKNTAIIIANLGSPDSYRVDDVKKYLREFLMDERIIDVPFLIRKMIVEGFILPTRPKYSAEAYHKIWTDKGSPLVVNTFQVCDELKKVVQSQVEVCMRYGNPKPEHVVQKLCRVNPQLEKILIVPMYPHYAMSSFETTTKHVIDGIKKVNDKIKVKVLPPYYSNETYIHALAASIKPFVTRDFDHLLFSFHGIPERHLKKTEPTHKYCLEADFECCNNSSVMHKYCYRHQVVETTKLVANNLELPENKFSHSFQSRLGKDNWLKPYTDATLKELPSKGIKKLLVACPAFTADCLETLEEIAVRGKETFLMAGGETFTMIPCLNDHEEWIKCLASWCNDEERFTETKNVLAYQYS
ncbi:MAG: ferrochelatase [Bacteroidia bacterium]